MAIGERILRFLSEDEPGERRLIDLIHATIPH
jgi:hypothetical protein